MNKKLPLLAALLLAVTNCGPRLQAQQFQDKFQANVPEGLVKKVDQAKEKQVSGTDLGAARQLLDEVLHEKPDYYRARYNLGLIYQSQGDTNKALETLEQAKAIRDQQGINDSSILNSIGWIQMNQGKLNEAEASYLATLSSTPPPEGESGRRVLNNLGYLYLQKGDTARSAAYLEQAIRDYDSTGAKKVLDLVNAAETQTAAITKASGGTAPARPEQATWQPHVEKLFAPSGAAREAGYDALTRTDLRKNAEVPAQIIQKARADFDNAPGVRMAVVTLRDMSRLATQAAANSAAIEAFAKEVDTKHPALHTETAQLRKWLAKPR